MNTYNDLWFAAKSTQIVYMPPKLLETFGESSVNYLIFSEDMDSPEKIRLRKGIVSAARPRIITPHYFMKNALENFGPEARKYFAEVLNSRDTARFMEYGLAFEKKEYNEELLSGQIMELASQAAKEAQDNISELRGVIIAVDDTWEISLLHFITELVKRSVPHHAREMSRKGLLDIGGGMPIAVRNELDQDFDACDTLNKAHNLAAKMRDYGVFDEFEDRFYELYKKLKK